MNIDIPQWTEIQWGVPPDVPSPMRQFPLSAIAMNRETLQKILRPRGQEHLLAFWDRLDLEQRGSLARQIEAIDFDAICQLYEGRNRRQNFDDAIAKSQSPPAFRLDALHHENPFGPEQAKERGREALRAGQVGVILVAGGQGTRLGFEHPKGMFPIGPISQKTLFQIHVEKIVAASRRYDTRIPLYLMTSPATHEETIAFFERHERFGLPAGDLRIFCQGTMPAVDAETGRVLLEAPDRVAVSPDGHGGMPAALDRSGLLADIERRGVRHLFYFQVDNPLVDICSPEFMGYHLLAGSELSSQVVAKRDPAERVGVVIRVGDRLMVIEYSDLPDEAARRRNADGSLSLWAGSIAVHGIDVSLLRRAVGDAEALPFHIARKKVPTIDAEGRPIEPSQPNAIKFERFIFDLIPQAQNAIVIEVDPARAFAPLKNAPGAKEDTPESVRRQMSALHSDWLRRCGAEIADGAVVEISPLFALDAESLSAKIPAGSRIAEPTYFG